MQMQVICVYCTTKVVLDTYIFIIDFWLTLIPLFKSTRTLCACICLVLIWPHPELVKAVKFL